MTDPERPVFLDGHALPGCAAGQWLDLTALGRLCDADHTLRPARIHQAHVIENPYLDLDGQHGADTNPYMQRTLDPPNAETHAIWPEPPPRLAQWYGTVLVLGVRSTDGRIVAEPDPTIECPLDLRASDSDPAPIGRIDAATIQRGDVVATGTIDYDRAAALPEVERDPYQSGRLRLGVGADLDVADVTAGPSETWNLTGVRLRAATVGVPPAWPHCLITIDPPEAPR